MLDAGLTQPPPAPPARRSPRFHSYCRRIMAPTFWGGEPELLVLSQMLRVPILVYIPAKEAGSRWGCRVMRATRAVGSPPSPAGCAGAEQRCRARCPSVAPLRLLAAPVVTAGRMAASKLRLLPLLCLLLEALPCRMAHPSILSVSLDCSSDL